MPTDAPLPGMPVTNGKAGRFTAATAYFREALRLRPDYLPAHFGYGMLLLAEQKWEEALPHLKPVADSTELKAPQACSRVARIYGRQGNKEMALHYFARAVELAPTQPALESRTLAPPIPVGPYFAYNEPVFVAPVYVAPVYVTPVYYQPVLPAPVMVVADWYAPAYVAPYRVSVRSSPWSYKAEFEYATPFGSREVEYRVDRHGRVRIDYDD